MNDNVGIAVFAKAPIEGFAKTRLIPHIGARGAADLQHRMIEHTVQVALASDVGPVSLWCTPSCKHELFSRLATTSPIELYTQSGADLGARMLDAFEVLTPNYPVIVIGTDCPVLEPSHLLDCANRLRQHVGAVFLPTEDGGYALAGAAQPWPKLFQNMPWGTERVMSETRLRARQIGLQVSEVALVWDIDTPEDYDRATALGLLHPGTGLDRGGRYRLVRGT